MPGRAEKEHSAPRLCLVPVQGTSKGREQSSSLGLKTKFKHQEVTQMQLRKGSSCKEKWVKEREHAAAAYLLLLDPSVRARVTLENKGNFKEQTSFTSSPSHGIHPFTWGCSPTAFRYPNSYRHGSPTVGRMGPKNCALLAQWCAESSLWFFNC